MLRSETAHRTLALALLVAVAHASEGAVPQEDKGAAVASTELQLPPRDSRQLPVIDGELSAAGIVDERSARITEALRARDYERAETLLLEAAEANPRSVEVLRLLGGVFFLRGRPLNAAVALKKAEAIGTSRRAQPLHARPWPTWPSDTVTGPAPSSRSSSGPPPPTPSTRTGSGGWTTTTSSTRPPSKSLLRAVELDPRLAKAHDSLGLCYEALGRFDEAVRSWRGGDPAERRAADEVALAVRSTSACC